MIIQNLHSSKFTKGQALMKRIQAKLFLTKKLKKSQFLILYDFEEIDIYLKNIAYELKKISDSYYEQKKIYIVLLKQIRHVKGKRIIFLMPLNGQRTHTNGQTVKYLFAKNKI